MFDGETAFTLYDTYGFPLDLTQDALRAARHRRRYRRVQRGDGAAARQGARVLGRLGRSGDRGDLVSAARESSAQRSFSATKPRAAEGVVQALVRDGKEVDRAEGRRDRQVIVNQTPFYGESGGQVGDTGAMTRRRRALCASPTRRRRPATCSFTPARSSRARSRSAHALALDVDHARRTRDPRAIIRRRISCTRRCARCSAITSRRRARWSRPTGCASISPIPSR